MKFAIEELANAIAKSRGQYIFWLGAGVSVTAGVPLCEGVVDRYLYELWSRDNPQPPISGEKPLQARRRILEARRKDIRNWAVDKNKVPEPANDDWGALYSDCLSQLPGDFDRGTFIDGCVEEAGNGVSFAAVLTAQLVRWGFVRTVLTTNFDGLVESALDTWSVSARILDPASASGLTVSPESPQIAYLHGKRKSYSQQRNLQREVQAPITGLKGFLTEALKDQGLVVVGYRGGDEAPMELLTRLIKARGKVPGRGLYWVSFEKDGTTLAPLVQGLMTDFPETRWLPGIAADDFFVRLCASPGIGLGIPRDQALETRFPPSLAQQYSEDYKEPDSTRLLHVRASEGSPFKKAEDRFQNDLAGAYSAFHDAYRQAGEAAADSEAQFNYGVGLMMTKHYPEALEHFQERVAKTTSRDAGALTLKGDLLQKLGRYEEAARAYSESADVRPCAPALNNWAVALYNLGRYVHAKEKFDEALRLEPAYRGAKRNCFAAERKLALLIQDEAGRDAKLAEIADRERKEAESDPDYGFTGELLEERKPR